MDLHDKELEYVKQKILLLHLLNDRPEHPSENVMLELDHPAQVECGSRTLSIHQERSIASAFALLAANSDDPGRVVAACVEEDWSGTSMVIKLAVNHGDLTVNKTLYKRMANVLGRVHQQETEPTEQDHETLLSEVIALNQNRILCRLRSKHARLHCNFKKAKSKRVPWVFELRKVTQTLTLDTREESSVVNREQTLEDAEHLISLFTSLERLSSKDASGARGRYLLLEIIRTCHRLRRSCGLFEQETSSLSTWVRALERLTRYPAICQRLIDYARKMPVFNDIRFEMVKHAATPRPTTELDGNTREAIRRLQGTPRGRYISARAEKEYGGNVQNMISSTVRSMRHPVHAEMQLLFHYTQVAGKFFVPRILCSNKKACYLCNLFCRVHGHFLVPSSHGRLYEKWSLPTPRLGAGIVNEDYRRAIIRFSEELNERLRQQVMLQHRPLPEPFESLIFSAGNETITGHESLHRLGSDVCQRVKPLETQSKTVRTGDIQPCPDRDLKTGDIGNVAGTIIGGSLDQVERFDEDLRSMETSGMSHSQDFAEQQSNAKGDSGLALEAEAPGRLPLIDTGGEPSGHSSSWQDVMSNRWWDPVILRRGVPVVLTLRTVTSSVIVALDKINVVLEVGFQRKRRKSDIALVGREGLWGNATTSHLRLEWLERHHHKRAVDVDELPISSDHVEELEPHTPHPELCLQRGSEQVLLTWRAEDS